MRLKLKRLIKFLRVLSLGKDTIYKFCDLKNALNILQKISSILFFFFSSNGLLCQLILKRM